ncbi:MAG: amino acid permease [Candidatus Micrarchaeaceae archaeon]
MPKLKRAIGLREALAINLAAIIGAGIYVISGIAAGMAGPASIIAVLISAVVSIFTGFSFAELAHSYASEGGNYEYSKEVLGNYAGFIAGIIWIFASIVSGSAIALSFAGYFDALLGIKFSEIVIAIVVIALLSLINYFGIKRSASTATLLIIINLFVLSFFVILGMFFVKASNYVPVFPKGIASTFVASAFIFFAYTGFARVTMLGEEIKEPKKTIPRAILYSIVISMIIYAIVMFILIGIAPYSKVSTSSSPLAAALLIATKRPWASYIISVGALLATFDVDLAMILGLSRVLFAMSRDKAIPAVFSRLNKYSVPAFSIFIGGIVMMAMLAFAFKEIVAISNAGYLFSYALANLAAIKLAIGMRHKPGNMLFGKHNFYMVPLIGLITTLALLLFLTKLSLALLATFLLIVTAYYFLSGKHRRRSAPHTKKANW